MPGKPSLGALLQIYSPRYVKSGPGDLPERPEKSPTLWGPLTRIYFKSPINEMTSRKVHGVRVLGRTWGSLLCPVSSLFSLIAPASYRSRPHWRCTVSPEEDIGKVVGANPKNPRWQSHGTGRIVFFFVFFGSFWFFHIKMCSKGLLSLQT